MNIVAADTKTVTQAMLDMYNSGLLVTTVNLQQSQPPEEVQGAFYDAIKAREDNVRFVNEAEAYSNGIIPKARGEAARILEEATQLIGQFFGNRKGPPDLDEVFKKLTDKLSGFGKKKGDNGDSGGSGRGGIAGLLGLAILGLIIWVASGFYIVSEGERGIVLRFGKYQVVTNPGPHWHIPTPFETVEMVDMEQVREFTHRASMLTEDENIVDIELAVQYLINDPVNFIFRAASPRAFGIIPFE